MRALGALGVIVVALILAYGVWLLATADQGDGGRQFVGLLIVGLAVPVLLIFGIALYVVSRPPRGATLPR
jgi:uncharacterized membrane protein